MKTIYYARIPGIQDLEFEADTQYDIETLVDAHDCIYRFSVKTYADGKVKFSLLPDNGIIEVETSKTCEPKGDDE